MFSIPLLIFVPGDNNINKVAIIERIKYNKSSLSIHLFFTNLYVKNIILLITNITAICSINIGIIKFKIANKQTKNLLFFL